MKLKVLEQNPATNVVSVDEAKAHSRVTHSRDDDYFERLIGAAVEYAEGYIARALRTKTFEMALERFPNSPDGIVLPKPPYQVVNSITYLDPDSVETELASGTWYVDDYDVHAAVHSNLGLSWPYAVACHPLAVKVNFTAGYDNTLSSPEYNVPEQAKQAVLVLVEEMYNVRGDTVFAADPAKIDLSQKLLGPLRVRV